MRGATAQQETTRRTEKIMEERSGSGLEYGMPAPKFRLPDATRLGRVRLQVGELERSLAFYEGVLGLRPLERSDTRAWLGSAGAGAPLIELHELRGAEAVPPQGRLGLFHYAILLPERGALGSLVRHLAELGERAGASDHLVSEALYLQDPDGLGIEVYADRPRATWRHRDGQLMMTTEPLDLESLERAADGAAWRGMPAGTCMGHVHLHVGDLDEAAAFYHEALGLDRMVWSYPGALFLAAGGYHHHLGVNTWARAARPAGQDHARLVDWELLLPTHDDVEAAIASLQSAGHPVERTTGGAKLQDPWGTALRLTAAGLTRPEAAPAR